ncbi:DUF2304 domain-containing protein [Cellulomonas sp. P24]|uniref:DUF2304 domain-containing protein n=1 Tax=Cellulomonas sp. P24 TaxID=2885206 RepID=UPI00216B5C09|nr:DUF2304 domain-containing protein [Cellulomonas sp. P24]MCR6491738.1 DUF2304 domain-containing protein [Cellulomonas sp. P24]
MRGYVFALTGALITLAFMFELLRRRRLREKYAALWISLAVVVIVVGAFPELLNRIATLVGIATPLNLVFFLGLLVLLVVCVQLSAELSSLEHEAQTLAEESALLRNRLERLERAREGELPRPPVADPSPHVGDPT